MPRPFSKGRFLLMLVTVVAVVLAFLSAMTLFFRVDEVIVAGTKQYTPYMVKEASGISEGDGLLGISKPRAAGKIRAELPYVKDVKISKSLPGTVRILVRELDVCYAIQAVDSSWWLIDSEGRVVESIQSSAASGYTQILGVKAEAPRIGQVVHAPRDAAEPLPTATGETEEIGTQPTENGLQIPTQPQITEQDRMETALQLLSLLERNEIIGSMAKIDVSSLHNVTMEYEDRFHVVVGTAENLSYKIAAMTSAVEQLEEYEIGELDVSFKFSEKVIFNPERG